MISRMAFWSLQASRILEAHLGPMPATSISRSPCCSITSNTASPNARTSYFA